jgi:hypothetical protein
MEILINKTCEESKILNYRSRYRYTAVKREL